MRLWCRAVFFIAVTIALLSFQVTIGASQMPYEKENLHVYLLIGQSNMAGYAPIESEDMGIIERTYLLNGSDEWEPAQNPINEYSSIKETRPMGLNCGRTFALEMIKNSADIGVGLVSNARGGTRLEQWVKGSEYYNEAVRRTREAMKTGTLKGILWLQGEGDAADSEYNSKLAALIDDFRKDFGNPSLPFIASQIVVNNVQPEREENHIAFNSRIVNLPSVSAFTGVIDASDLWPLEDGIHFNSAAQRLIGIRYAQQINRIYNLVSCPSTAVTNENIAVSGSFGALYANKPVSLQVIAGKNSSLAGASVAEKLAGMTYVSTVIANGNGDFEFNFKLYEAGDYTVRVGGESVLPYEQNLSCISGTIPDETKPDENFHIYLLLGQSNMAGRADIESGDTGVIRNVLLLNESDGWEEAENPLNRYSTIRKDNVVQGLGPGWTFAKTLAQTNSDVKVGLVVNARGGSSINEWAKGEHYYNEAVRRAKEAAKTGVLKGVLWLQGEQDAADSADYSLKLEKFISDIRNELSNKSLPFVACEVITNIENYPTRLENHLKINAQLKSAVENIPFSALVTTAGLGHIGDEMHYNSEAQREIGVRFAQKIIAFQNSNIEDIGFARGNRLITIRGNLGALLADKMISIEVLQSDLSASDLPYLTIADRLNAVKYSSSSFTDALGNYEFKFRMTANSGEKYLARIGIEGMSPIERRFAYISDNYEISLNSVDISENDASISVLLTNITDIEKSCKIALSFYSKEGVLLGIKLIDGNATPNKTELYSGVLNDVRTENISKVKAFLLESVDNMMPISIHDEYIASE